MKPLLALSAPIFANRAIHSMGVIVIALFAFHFARLSGFTPVSVAIALVVAAVAAASLGLSSATVVQPDDPRLSKTVSLFSVPLLRKPIALQGRAWTQVRPELPDLVVEIESADGSAIEIARLKNGYGGKESQAASLARDIATILGIEDHGCIAQETQP